MNNIFGDMEDVVVIYIDDIMVFTKTDDEAEHDRVVLEPEKCFFKKKEVEFLGMIMGVDGIKMDESKVKAIREWPTPTKVKSIRVFLGLANFYCHFIKDFACIARPLNDLTRKDQLWTWQEEQQRSFEVLKEAFTSAPILTFPDQDRRFHLETDASDFATGAVLSVEAPDGLWHPVFDKEMLGIIRALETWCHYLEATPYEFKIWTDHSNLQYFKTAQNLDRRQARWAQYLLHFNYKLIYKPGASMAKADALSRREDHEIKGDNQGVTLIDCTRIAALSVGMDRTLEAILKGATSATTPPEGYKLREGLYIRNSRVYVPPSAILPVIEAHHNTPVAGHPGWSKTLELVSWCYVWPAMSQSGSRKPPAGKLHPNPVPEVPWVDISVDFMDAPAAGGYDNIMVVVDQFSKEAVFIPTVKTISALGTAELFHDHVWTQHGLPSTVISDCGPQFASIFMMDLSKMLGIKPKLSTAFHPQTDGQTEHLNQEVQQYLWLFINDQQHMWPSWLKIAQFSYNSRRQDSVGRALFSITHTYIPCLGVEPVVSRAEAATMCTSNIQSVIESTQKALQRMAE
ncbi:hypothetical protein PISMIDRAFT_17785 [Pisolithus microcarpus 441]|uniref:Integrase catalytic domain-containing protein n=1 Tax=Pisolithus microcarpus 441 TaxID=765257 RepID=A0A0C9YA28_9AGAM|nr:hypothetical protein PISMIDRAFT_17785 [Pisolithus microcarpus 441]